MSTVLIGLNGAKESGKNTVGDVIQKWGENRGLVVTQRGFADLMKLSAARALGLETATNVNDAVVLMDSLKRSGDINIVIPEQSLMKEISGREYLKWFGTEAHRDVFGKNFWLDLLLPLHYDWTMQWVSPDDDPCEIAVVTDCRFLNEAERIRKLGGVVWEIKREGVEWDGHPSETPLLRHLVNMTIANDSTLEAFRTKINSLMTAEYHMRFAEHSRAMGFDV